MKLVLPILLICCAISAAQKLYAEDFWLFQGRTNGMTEAKLKSLVTNLNKEKLAAQKKRVATFISKNVPKANQASETNHFNGMLVKVDQMKRFMDPIYAAIKKSKVVADAKQKEFKKFFNNLDYDKLHKMSTVYPEWLKKCQAAVAADKWKKLNTTITKTDSDFKKANAADWNELFYKPTAGTKG